jgi:DNA-directed RNA polymerase subunit beta
MDVKVLDGDHSEIVIKELEDEEETLDDSLNVQV